MDSYLATLSRRAGILSEGVNYLGMFSDLIRQNPKLQSRIEVWVRWAKQNLKKNDRIIWFLRWARIYLLSYEPIALPNGQQKTVDTELARMAKQLGTYYPKTAVPDLSNLMPQLQHFTSLPIAGIQNMVWQAQSPGELIRTFATLEKQWKEEQNNTIDMANDSDAEAILEFPDGFTWFNLNRGFCGTEAKAMGHCGNAGEVTGGNILSLRKKVQKGDVIVWHPVLTFIVDDEGYLGEMKGRGNDKPVERYHPYIVALLQHDIIQGIKGGGYRPENNFHINDLKDEKQRQALIDAKPGFLTVDELYTREGMTDRVMERLEAGLDSHNARPRELKYDPQRKRFLLGSWKTLEGFIKHELYDEPLEKLIDLADNIQVSSAVTINELADMVSLLPPQYQEQILARAGVPATSSTFMDHAVRTALSALYQRGDDWISLMIEAYDQGGAIRNQVLERIGEYISVGWPFASSYVYLSHDKDDDNNWTHNKHYSAQQVEQMLISPVEMYIDEQELINYASASHSDSGDDEYANELLDMSRDRNRADWTTVSDYIDENRRERGLVGKDGHDLFLKGVDSEIGDDATSIAATTFMNMLQGNRPTSHMTRDPNQLSFGTELDTSVEELDKLRDRAGIPRK